jgi:hypothetical protein
MRNFLEDLVIAIIFAIPTAYIMRDYLVAFN